MWSVDETKQKAMAHDPIAMFHLAQMYRSGEITSSNEDLDIVWLKRFFEHPVVDGVLRDLDEEDGDHSIDFLLFTEEYSNLRDCIIEAGIALGLYYCKSNHLDELYIARDSLYSALLSSRYDWLQTDVDGDLYEVNTIFYDVLRKIERLEGNGDHDE